MAMAIQAVETVQEKRMDPSLFRPGRREDFRFVWVFHIPVRHSFCLRPRENGGFSFVHGLWYNQSRLKERYTIY